MQDFNVVALRFCKSYRKCSIAPCKKDSLAQEEPSCKAFCVPRTLQQEGRTSQRPGRFFLSLLENPDPHARQSLEDSAFQGRALERVVLKPAGLAYPLPGSKAPVGIYPKSKGPKGRRTELYSLPTAKYKRPQKRSGFVLLLVVMLLAVCCLIFTQLSLKSFSRVNQFVKDQRDLQEYWASTSLRKATLPHASTIWQQHRDASLDQAELLINLCDRSYHVRLENENTKLNLRHVWQDFPVQASRGLLQIQLMALDSSVFTKFEELNGQVYSWRQLCNSINSQTLDQTDNITLWGTGQIDVTQASDETIEQAWKGLFGTFPPKELYAAKQRWPRPSWPELRSQLGFRDTQLELADRWFSTDSRCFSLEILWQLSPSSTSGYLFIRDATNNFGFSVSP